ncbi:MAG: exopolyphosphatase [Chitinophagaceae bacterium]|nr:MAG: exopolyphosphatase [Chitinophagaceae bacterium]
MKLAAIDIGSNAARLLIMQVIEQDECDPSFTKLNLIRIPLRLGFDISKNGAISSQKRVHIIETMKAYKFLLDVYEVDHFKACATAAFRNAANREEILTEILKETQIDLKIITGEQEADFIFQNHIAEKLNKSDNYIYIDVGGGSTEICIFNRNKLRGKASFNIGTIGLLENRIKKSDWNLMKEFIKKKTLRYENILAIGSGGNINKVASLSGKKDNKPLYLGELEDYFHELSRLTVDERIKSFRLSPDRADVIVPALDIYIKIMQWAGAVKIFVPKIGLADGLIHALYDEVKKPTSTETTLK